MSLLLSQLGGGGPPDVTGNITASMSLSAAATAREVVQGSATAGLNLSSTASGREVVRGTGSGSLTLAAAATGLVEASVPPQSPGGGYWNSHRRKPKLATVATYDFAAEEDELIAITLNHFLNN